MASITVKEENLTTIQTLNSDNVMTSTITIDTTGNPVKQRGGNNSVSLSASVNNGGDSDVLQLKETIENAN